MTNNIYYKTTKEASDLTGIAPETISTWLRETRSLSYVTNVSEAVENYCKKNVPEKVQEYFIGYILYNLFNIHIGEPRHREGKGGEIRGTVSSLC